jgi:hypothetical protein
MNRRFWIICLVIGSGLLTLSVLGLSSLKMHRKGLQAERQQEFMDVAKQISFDVKKKVDVFLQAEQNRLYTDYQPYYVPDIGNQAAALVPSPLANLYSNGFANGYFQLESDGQLISPHFAEQQMQQMQQSKQPANYSDYFDNIRQNLLPSLANGQTVATHRIEPTEREIKEDKYSFDARVMSRGRRIRTPQREADSAFEKDQMFANIPEDQLTKGLGQKEQVTSKSKAASSRRSVYPISNLKETQQTTQVVSQRRDNYEVNLASNEAQLAEEPASQAIQLYNTVRVQSEETSSQQAHPQTPRQEDQQSSYG